MDLQTMLLQRYSKAQTMAIADYVGNDAQRFAQLMTLFFEGEYRLTQRAAQAVRYCVSAHPALVVPYLERMVHNLPKPVHDAVKRNTLRILEDVPLPESLWGELVGLCFDFLTQTKTAVAIKVFAMTVLLRITTQLPDLKPELQLMLEEQLPYGSPAFVDRASKVLQALKKI